MKRILITITILLFSLTSFSQMDFTKFNGHKYYDNLDDAVNIIIESNPNMDSDNIRSYEYKFDDGRKLTFFIFTDRNGYFLDIIFFRKDVGIRYGIQIMTQRRYENLYRHKRKITDFESNLNDQYKLIMDDGSYITLIFERVDSGKVDDHCFTSYCDYSLEDHKTEEIYLWGYLNYKSTKVSCK